jgi:hypothetical protein
MQRFVVRVAFSSRSMWWWSATEKSEHGAHATFTAGMWHLALDSSLLQQHYQNIQ